jgi:hypothetical protein
MTPVHGEDPDGYALAGTAEHEPSPRRLGRTRAQSYAHSALSVAALRYL